MENKQPRYFSEMIAQMDHYNNKPWEEFMEEETYAKGPLEGTHTIIGLTALAYLSRYHQYFDQRGGSRRD